MSCLKDIPEELPLRDCSEDILEGFDDLLIAVSQPSASTHILHHPQDVTLRSQSLQASPQ